ncbi:MAG: zinc-dependent metalloprotease family protein, partial [Planctomycetota bacterium]
MATYIHGMTEEIAQNEFGPESVTVLIELLADPDFPRRDNIVAVLGYLGNNHATTALLNLLKNPPGLIMIPEEERALLLAPQSLGQIAGRGEPNSLKALMAMTSHGNNGDILASTAQQARNPAAFRDDLIHMAMRGLAYSGSAKGLGRLQAINRGTIKPAPRGKDLKKSANQAIELLDRLYFGNAVSESSGGIFYNFDGEAGNGTRKSSTLGIEMSGTVSPAFDGTHLQVNNSLLDYANHVDVTNPMTDTRLDDILADASLRMGRADFSEDVACCAGIERTGTEKEFGTEGDDLDVIDNNSELSQVLNDNTARVKIVKEINYCGGSGTNIIGCAWIGGNGMAVVRRTNLGQEGVLWAHEYGHNTGLQHNTTGNSYIMYGTLSSTNKALTQPECDNFHTPVPGAQAILDDIGECTDIDGDEVQDLVDNCPGIPNNDQNTEECKPITIVWQDNTPGNNEIYLKTSTDGAITWTIKRLTWNSGDSVNPMIAVNGSNVYVVWEQFMPSESDTEIFFKRSSDDGSTWMTNRLTWNSGDSVNPTVAVNGSNVYVAWEDYSVDTDSEIYLKKSSDGGSTWTTKRLSWNSGDSVNPTVAVNGSNVYVAWEDYSVDTDSEIFLKTSPDGGTSWTKKRLTWNSGNSVNPTVAVNGSNVYVAWENYSVDTDSEIYLKRSSDGGSTWTTKRLTWNSGNSVNPTVAVNGSNVYVA